MKSLLDNIGSGSHEPSVVSDILSNDQSKVEADQAWAQLQQDLDAAGVSPEMSTQNHDFILLTLRNMVENGNTISKKPLAVLKDVPDPAFEAQHSDRKTSLNDTDDWLANGSKDLPFLPPTPRNDSLLNDPSAQLYHGHSKKPSAAEETLPISVAFDIQDSAITRSQPLPHEDFPILVSTELPPEKGISQHSNQIIPTAPIALDTLKVTRNKKTNRMSRVIFQMTNSKQKLITPVQHGDLEAVKTLLEKGADANAINNEGHTPLMAAASYGHESIVRILIEHGAKLDNVASSRETALGAAAARGFERIVRMLIASGANIEAGSNKAKTALSEAASYGQDRIVTLLLDCGADINAINFTGQTALAAAALNGNMRVARVLLDRGADLDRMGYAGQSPLFKAIKQNYAEMVVLLMERGANPGVLAGFEKSETALSFAARMQRYHILGIFRRYGYEAGLIQYC